MIINDQASALRQLKKLVEINSQEPTPTAEELLASIQRPTPFLSVAAIVPDGSGKEIPPIQSWIGRVIGNTHRACIWDQAGVLSAGTPAMENSGSLMPSVHSVEAANGPLMVISRNPEILEIHKKQVPERIRFVRNLTRLLVPYQEFWITLQAGEINFHQHILHGTDFSVILVPETTDSVIRGYEAVKSVRLSGYFSPIVLLQLTERETAPEEDSIERIRSVARQFLSLDLPAFRVVLSDVEPSGRPLDILKSTEEAIPREHRDFQFYLAERLIYPAPGDNR